ncbi:MAG: peptide chain release factor N(5)-glutamine methyltransferase [Candidatus Accumulibacter sp.]|nr:peptide chain release factor N(5)-glutamine methyltransferase [Accumulibacter sp.]
MTSIGAAWCAASQSIDRLDARLLVEHLAPCTHADLIAHPQRLLAAAQVSRLEALVKRRAAGEPLAYLLGSAEFHGLTFLVTPAVLIPRPETELLVELAVQHLRCLPVPRIVDLGTGCGVVAVTIGHLCPGALVTAVDRSRAALEVACVNSRRHAVEVEFLASDWYSALADAHFDLIVANPPYVADADPHLQQDGLQFEPPMALTDGVVGGDGLACIRVIVDGAAQHLVRGGGLLIEHGYDQAAEVRHLLQQAGLSEVASWHDLAGIERVSGGRLR